MDDKDNRAEDAIERAAHSATADKAKGHFKEAIGKAKEQIGGALGDRNLERQGAVQRAEGKKDRLKGELKESVDDVKARVKAGAEAVKEKIDEVRGRR